MIEILDKYDSDGSESESSLSNFYRLGRDRFEISLKGGFDYINSIKESIKILSFDLPVELKEIFIPYSDAPIYWIYESGLLTQIEDFMKMHFVRAKYLDLHRSMKENYTKWVATNLKNEKDYYANLTINFIERDIYKHNFFKQIIHGIILTYHHPFYNPSKALDLFESSKGLVNTLRLQEQLKNELNYILCLYAAFVHFKEKEYEKANTVLKEGLDAKTNGITAKFYTSLAELHLGNEDIAAFHLREVLSFDFHRLNTAMDINNPGMFYYFFKNAFIYNIFYEKDFAIGSKIIETILHPYSLADQNVLKNVLHNIEFLKEKKIKDYLTEDITKSITFLEKVAQNFLVSKNNLIIGLYTDFERKYNEVIDALVERAKTISMNEINAQLLKYEDAIKESVDSEKHLKIELENFKAKTKEVLNQTITFINEDFDHEIVRAENRINNLHTLDKYSPQRSFSINMTYNLIIAFVIFLIGGIASYSNRVVSDISEFNTILSYVLLSGAKWGVISFCIGGLISLIVAGLVLIERADEKQKLIKKMGYLKLEKERRIKEAKEYAEEKEKIMTENMNNSIAQHKRKVEEFTVQRNEEFKKLKEEADNKIAAFEEDLSSINAPREEPGQISI